LPIGGAIVAVGLLLAVFGVLAFTKWLTRT
jgi:hypothetical protein